MTAHRTNRNQLRIAYHNNLNLWLTPWSQTCYWNSRPSWIDDKVVAEPQDFVDDEGFDFDPEDTESDDNDIFTADI